MYRISFTGTVVSKPRDNFLDWLFGKIGVKPKGYGEWRTDNFQLVLPDIPEKDMKVSHKIAGNVELIFRARVEEIGIEVKVAGQSVYREVLPLVKLPLQKAFKGDVWKGVKLTGVLEVEKV